jgi:hypothetical protein
MTWFDTRLLDHLMHLQYIGVGWSDKVEMIHLMYSDGTGLTGKYAFLHPSALITNLGKPDYVRFGVFDNKYYRLYLAF